MHSDVHPGSGILYGPRNEKAAGGSAAAWMDSVDLPGKLPEPQTVAANARRKSLYGGQRQVDGAVQFHECFR